MFDFIKFRYQLHKLQRKLEKVKKKRDKIIKRAKKENEDQLTIRQIYAEFEQVDLIPIKDEIISLLSNYLIKEATKLLLPIPDYNNKKIWQITQYSRQRVLTDRGINKIRREIRNEKKEKRDMWFPILSLLIGLIGAITALVSVMKK